MVVDSLHTQFRVGRRIRQPAGQRNYLVEALLSAQLIDRRRGHTAHHCDLRSHIGDEDHVARLQPDVFGLVPVQQQVVQVEVGDRLASALYLNVAQAALRKRPTRGKQGIQQRAQRSDRIAARLHRLADHEDLDRPQLSQVNIQVKVAIDAS